MERRKRRRARERTVAEGVGAAAAESDLLGKILGAERNKN